MPQQPLPQQSALPKDLRSKPTLRQKQVQVRRLPGLKGSDCLRRLPLWHLRFHTVHGLHPERGPAVEMIVLR